MCGLVGIAGDMEFKDEAAMKRLLLLDYFRGTDSTGFASVSRHTSEIKLAKVDSHPITLFSMKQFDKALQGYNSKVFIGHNRAATIGKVNEHNAHPFVFGPVVGAHNGTLDRPSWDRLQRALGRDTDTDSQAIFACIEKIGIDETIALMEEGKASTTGAWALTWYDSRDNTINFLRNPHRPLWYAWTKDFKKILWASEHPMIDGATRMSANPYDLYKSPEGYQYWEFKTNQLYSFKLDEMAKGASEKPVGIVREIKGREPVVYNQPPFYNMASHKAIGQSGTTTTYHGKESTSTNVYHFPDVVDITGTASRPLADQIPLEKFNDLAKYGCQWCSADVDINDPGVTVYLNQDTVLCGNCSGHDNPRVVKDYDGAEDLKIPVNG